MNLSPREKDLSPRELEILSWVSEGYTDGQIANAFHIKERTVRYHLQEARVKLNASCRATAIKRAMQLGYPLEAPILPVYSDR